MRIIGSEVLPNLLRPESLQEERGTLRGASTKTPRQTLASSADQVELSSQAREVQRLHQLVRGTPEIRESRVVDAQSALTARSLPLDGRTLAPKLLVDAIGMATSRPA